MYKEIEKITVPDFELSSKKKKNKILNYGDMFSHSCPSRKRFFFLTMVVCFRNGGNFLIQLI